MEAGREAIGRLPDGGETVPFGRDIELSCSRAASSPMICVARLGLRGSELGSRVLASIAIRNGQSGARAR